MELKLREVMYVIHRHTASWGMGQNWLWIFLPQTRAPSTEPHQSTPPSIATEFGAVIGRRAALASFSPLADLNVGRAA